MAQSKATKKFEKNHLSDILKKRKDVAKIKQRNQLKAKKKARRIEEETKASPEPDDTRKLQKKKQDDQTFEDMNVDDFFQGGFEIPEAPKSKTKLKAGEATKGRKRTADGNLKSDDASSSEDESMSFPAQADNESDSDSDDMEAHKQQLDALAEKDPEFHKYLQENDADLLDFQDADLAEIDALSGSEEEQETPKKKKQKKGKKADLSDDSADEAGESATNEVTKVLLKKWQAAMTEKHSLRATKEVVLAFRAAAHVSDEEDKNFKYSVSSPEAYHELLVTALKQVPEVLQHHIPVKETQAGKV